MRAASSGLRHPASASCLGRHARLAGRCPNNSSLFPPLAAVVVVAAEELLIIRAKSGSLRAARHCVFTSGVGGYPLSHGLRRASSPKGTPLRYAASFSATAKSRPLGEGGIAAGDDGRGTPGQAALCFSLKLCRYAKGPILEGAVERMRDWGSSLGSA